MSKLDIFLEDEAGITSHQYQRRTSDVVGAILAHFSGSPHPKTAHVRLASLGEEKIPLTVRAMLDPPSVQIFQYPMGGVNAGKKRVREKLHKDGFIEHIPGFVTVGKTDLTREIIALTVGGPKMQEIIESGLISPEQMAELLELLRLGHQHLLIVVKRHLLGIEPEIGIDGPINVASAQPIKIPFTVATESDEDTFGFLERLPDKLGTC